MTFNKTLLTYCEDVTALIAEINTKFPERLDSHNPDDIVFKVIKTPTISNAKGNTLTAVLSTNPSEEIMLRSLKTLVVMGTYEEVFSKKSMHELYKSVHPYDVPLTFTDENGVKHTYMRPKKIGGIA